MSKKQKISHCHWQIKQIACEMAAVAYDKLMGSNNQLFAKWKEKHSGLNAVDLEKAFIRKYWPEYIHDARATLAHMLAVSKDEDLKSSIHEVLVLDAQLVRGRRVPQVLLGAK